MSCLPPDQIPDDAPQPDGMVKIRVDPYTVTEVGIDTTLRRVAILFHRDEAHMQHGGPRPSPGNIYSEKEVVKLILRLQEALALLRQLPL